MNNLTLNIYKAFGIRKAPRPSYSVQLHNFVLDEDTKGLPTREFHPREGYDDTQRYQSLRKAMHHAINHVRNTNSPANIFTPTGGNSLLYAHPKTGLLTLRHVSHSDDENDLVHHSYNRFTSFKGKLPPHISQSLANRDTAAFNRLNHLHKNSLLTLGDTPMHIDTMDLSYLPAELHTTDEARDFNKPL